MTDGADTDPLDRIADALELQNALLLEVVHQQHRARAARHPDPDRTGPSGHSIASDVVDSYGDLYGGRLDGWEFDPVAEQTEDMGR